MRKSVSKMWGWGKLLYILLFFFLDLFLFDFENPRTEYFYLFIYLFLALFSKIWILWVIVFIHFLMVFIVYWILLLIFSIWDLFSTSFTLVSEKDGNFVAYKVICFGQRFELSIAWVKDWPILVIIIQFRCYYKIGCLCLLVYYDN